MNMGNQTENRRGKQNQSGRQSRAKVFCNLCDSRGGFSEDLLKLTAVITMFIDHVGAGILENLLRVGLSAEINRSILWQADGVLRLIGRMAFPIFMYLLLEGFLHTRSRLKYGLRLFLFALLSEVPFDLLFFGKLTLEYQNVYWTLLLGLITLCCMELAEEMQLPRPFTYFFLAASAAAGGLAAWLMRTDYSWKGIVLIAMLYLFRNRRGLQCILAPAAFLVALAAGWLGNGAGAAGLMDLLASEWTVFLSFYMIYRCNGKRYMRKNKLFFYAFYPLHLLFLLFFLYIFRIVFG